MKYYLHDSSAFDDEKITQLYIQFGYEGLGLFYTLLEKFAKQEKPIRTNVLKHQLNVGKKLEKCWNFMEEIGLIQSNNGETFNEQLLNFSEKYQVKKEKNKIRLREWRENQSITKNETHYESVSNTPKVKESKVKESKVNIVNEKIDLETLIYPYNSIEYKSAFQDMVKARFKKKEQKQLQTMLDKVKGFTEEIGISIFNDNYINNWKGFIIKDSYIRAVQVKPPVESPMQKLLKIGGFGETLQ